MEDVFKACRSKRPSFYANCSLTPTRDKIFYAARKLKSSHPNVVKSCRAVRGEVVVFVADPSTGRPRRGRPPAAAPEGPRDKRFVLTTRAQLEDFARNILKTDLSNMELNW